QDLGPYKDAVADAERSLGDAATAAGGMRDANSLLVDLILMDLTPALRDIKDLLAELGGIEAKPKITMEELVSAGPGGMGFTAEDGGTAYTGLSGRIGRIGSDLDNLDGQSAMVTANITDNAIEPLTRIEEKILGLDGDSFTVTAYVDIGPALQS